MKSNFLKLLTDSVVLKRVGAFYLILRNKINNQKVARRRPTRGAPLDPPNILQSYFLRATEAQLPTCALYKKL